LGAWFSASWDRANYLHVWGFHEARLDADAVRERAPDVEKMVREAEKLIKPLTSNFQQQPWSVLLES